ncbi:MAG: BlaI/MecI/CopY family transcriptional regulator [Thermoanaerobacteraceae bacterium]|nr:BlaI/MecI/CopY family transcriptional regulator [Thermoanaerobacteraceae bacterium]
MKLKSLIGEFRPRQKGLGKVMGPLEAAVMEIMWKKEEATVRDVFETLSRERRIAYTTVMTIMSRLADKNLLTKDKRGIAYVYRPAVSREHFTKSLVGEVLDGLFEDYADAAFSHFLKHVEEDEEKITQLEKLIRQRRNKGE